MDYSIADNEGKDKDNNDKKGNRGAKYAVKVTEPSVLLLLLDTRAEGSISWHTKGEGLPKFEKTNDLVLTDADFAFRVYRAEVKPGTYTFLGQNDASFYTIAVLKK